MNSISSRNGNSERRPVRLSHYDYSSHGGYFVTICTFNRACILGDIRNGIMYPNAIGRVVQERWYALPDYHPHVTLDAFVVMPNHIHGIILLTENDRTHIATRHGLPEIIRGFKTFSAHRVNLLRKTPTQTLWQRGFYEHVIRNGMSLNKIQEYIQQNPLRWHLDKENPNCVPTVGAGLNPPLHKNGVKQSPTDP